MDVNLLIKGQDQAAASGKVFERRNPLSQQVASRAAAATVEDADAAVAAATAALPDWSALGPNARRGLLLKAADVLEAKRDAFVAIMMAEIGTTEVWSAFNVKLATGMLREAASLTTQVAGKVIPSDKPGCLAMAIRQPAGVCLGIAPWNAPIILGVRAVAAPLACGNTVVLKASEICPGTHRLIGEVFRGCGISARRRQRRDQCADGRARRRRASHRQCRSTKDQLHRLNSRRSRGCRACRTTPQTRAARAGRQGTSARARRCRS